MTNPTNRTPSTFTGARRVATALAIGVLTGLAQAGTLEVLVLDKEGKPVPDAVVIVVPSGLGVAKNPPPMAAVVNQEKMQFLPPVSVVALGAKVRFANNDAWDHHVRLTAPGTAVSANPASAEGMSLRLEGKTAGKPAYSAVLTLDKPGATGAVLLGCFIHGSMSGHVYVADSPWTVKTEANGIAVLEDVPEGSATAKVWHAAQVVDKTPQTLVVGSTPAKLTLQLDVVPKRRRG